MDSQKIHHQTPPEAGLSPSPASGGMEPFNLLRGEGESRSERGFLPCEKSFFDLLQGYPLELQNFYSYFLLPSSHSLQQAGLG